MDKKSPKVRKDLNLFSASGAPLVIKVLTDLENRHNTFFYRHVGPLGPEERTREKKRFAQRPRIAGDRPPRYGVAAHPAPHRSARACPSHAPRPCSSGSPDPERVRGDNLLALQVHRTLMSIAAARDGGSGGETKSCCILDILKILLRLQVL